MERLDTDTKTISLIKKINLFEGHFADQETFVLYLPLWVVDVIMNSISGFPNHSKVYARMVRRICYRMRSFDPDDYKGGVTIKNVLKHIDTADTYWPDSKEIAEWIATYYHADDLVVEAARNKKYKDYAAEEIFSMAYHRCYMSVADYFIDALVKADPYKESKNG